MNRKIMIGATVALGLALAPLTASARTLKDPSDATVRLLQQHLAGKEPFYEEDAKNTEEYRRADEFTRADVLKKQIAKEKSEYQSLADVDGLVITVGAYLGDWNSDKGGFMVPLFKTGTTIQLGTGVGFKNAPEARYWKMPVDQAKKVREKLGKYSSSTRFLVTLADLSLNKDKPYQIDGVVKRVEIMNDDVVVGSYEPKGPRKVDTSLDIAQVADDLAKSFGVPKIGTSFSDARDWALDHSVAAAWRFGDLSGPEMIDKSSDPRTARRWGMSTAPIIMTFTGSKTWANTSANNFGRARMNDDPDTNISGDHLNCHTEDPSDMCGYMIFQRDGDKLTLSEILAYKTYTDRGYLDRPKAIAGADLAGFRMQENTQVSTRAGRLNGITYLMGPDQKTGPVDDPRYGWTNEKFAPLMIYSFDGPGKENTAILRLSAADAKPGKIEPAYDMNGGLDQLLNGNY